GPSVEASDDGGEDPAVGGVEAEVVDLEAPQGILGDLLRDPPVAAHLGEVAHAPQEAVRDARGAARAPPDLVAAGVFDGDAEQAGRPPHAGGELGGDVEGERLLDGGAGGGGGSEEVLATGGGSLR